jgi:SAM-dependent methyltransferase
MLSAIPLPQHTTIRPHIKVLLEGGERLSADIGCGRNPQNPFNAEKLIGFDIASSQEGIYPCVVGYEAFPLDDNSVDFVSAFDFIGHLPRNAIINGHITNPFIDMMSEIWRILKPGGLFYAQTPAYPSNGAFVNPSTVNVITEGTVSYFAKRFGLDGEAVDVWGLDQGRQNGFHGEFLLLNQWWSGTNLCWKLRCEKGVKEEV